MSAAWAWPGSRWGALRRGKTGGWCFRSPALYRLSIRLGGNEAVYIGETDNLSRRFGNYRNPGPSQQTSKRIHAKLKDALKAGAEIAVAVVLGGAWIDWGKGQQEADLSSKIIRCLFENAAIADGGSQQVEMLNRAS